MCMCKQAEPYIEALPVRVHVCVCVRCAPEEEDAGREWFARAERGVFVQTCVILISWI